MKRAQQTSRSPKPAAKTTAAKQSAAATKRAAKAKPPGATKRGAAAKPAPAARRAAAKKPARRADLGKPIAGFFAKQPAPLRAILEELRELIQQAAPDAESSLKWGMPWFTIGGSTMCALAGHKSHVNLILSGTPKAYADPDQRLTGAAQIGRHLRLTAADQVPRDAVRGWLATAAKLARSA